MKITIEVKQIGGDVWGVDFNNESLGVFILTGTKERCEKFYRKLAVHLTSSVELGLALDEDYNTFVYASGYEQGVFDSKIDQLKPNGRE